MRVIHRDISRRDISETVSHHHPGALHCSQIGKPRFQPRIGEAGIDFLVQPSLEDVKMLAPNYRTAILVLLVPLQLPDTTDATAR